MHELIVNDTIDDAVFEEVLDTLILITEPTQDERNKPLLDDFRNLIGNATEVLMRKTTIKEKELDVRVISFPPAMRHFRVKTCCYLLTEV